MIGYSTRSAAKVFPNENSALRRQRQRCLCIITLLGASLWLSPPRQGSRRNPMTISVSMTVVCCVVTLFGASSWSFGTSQSRYDISVGKLGFYIGALLALVWGVFSCLISFFYHVSLLSFTRDLVPSSLLSAGRIDAPRPGVIGQAPCPPTTWWCCAVMFGGFTRRRGVTSC